MDKEFGGNACRFLVPGYSEIYSPEDLIWDNTNRALGFREDIFNLQFLNDEQLDDFAEKLGEIQLDNYTRISGLIGVAFDENTVWGQST